MMNSAKDRRTVLVVDDDRHILEVIEARFRASGYGVITCPEARKAVDVLKEKAVDVLITDVRMPVMGGMDLLREVRLLSPTLPVILLTGYGTIPDAVQAMKDGATDYLTKPFDGRELLKKVSETLRKTSPASSPAPSRLSLVLWGGQSAAMRKLYDLVERVTHSDVNVLILGESGVGKELIAHLIHQRGPRQSFPFVVVDCGSTPTGLLESELFGHVRGSFTHAIRDKKGLIEAAHTGTLFLDEIGNISTEMQVRLLRFLEDRKIRRVGGLKEVPVDCRIISATNLDLAGEVEAGRFRSDLYYRLRVVTITVPPLRERREDIPLLAERFVAAFCEKQNLPPVDLPKETLQWLCDYPWLGNVRELKNALEGAVVLCKGGVMHPTDLHLTGLPDAPRCPPVDHAAVSLEENVRDIIIDALEKSGWVQKDAARLLGISRRALNYRIKKLRITPPWKTTRWA